MSSGTDVVTYHNDIARTGQNLHETILNYDNVNSSGFGKLFTANTTWFTQLRKKDSVYAFDADTGTQLWHVSVLAKSESPSDTHACWQTDRKSVSLPPQSLIVRADPTEPFIWLP